jgi:predicted AlkP superfamily phosphohydrolase/phosphomutase
VALLASCSQRPAADRYPVTIVGVDGAAWRVIDPLVRRGALPNLARLIANGTRAPLRSQMPLLSPAVWTTVASGVSRERHGVTGFRNAARHLVSSADRKAPTLWTVASQAGLKSAVIGWWATYPAEPINGVVVSERALKTRDQDLRDMLGEQLDDPALARLVHPPGAMKPLADLILKTPEVADPADDLTKVPIWMRHEDGAVARALLRLRERVGPFDLEMVLLRGLDPVSHFFWKFYEPDAPAYSHKERPRADDVEKYGRTIENHYRYVDSLIGELCAGDARDRVVIVVSDHGFEAGQQTFRRGTILSGTHRSPAAREGIFIASGGPVRRGARLAAVSVTDIAPTALHLLGLPVAEDLEGRVLEEAFDGRWAAGHPPRTVPTYAPPAAPPPAPEAATAVEAESAAERRIREELRALGYIE